VLQKTKGIVFRFVKFGETSIIASIFTEQFGLQSYIVKGVRTNSRKSKIALFQPMTLLDMVVYHKEGGGIMNIKEVKCFHPYQFINSDVRKAAIAMFINEVLNKSVQEQSHTQDIFNFIADSMIYLDTLEQPENFHLMFLIGLSKHLGFGPNLSSEVLGGRMITEAEEVALQKMLNQYTHQADVPLTYEQRKNILTVLLRFYQSHSAGFGEMKSVAVLKEVLS
jgi:DNA repair protein RecO (recombination protein O)